MIDKVTIETKVWEGDWLRMIVGRQCIEVFERNRVPHHRRVIINNVADPIRVQGNLAELVAAELIDDYLLVDDWIDEALANFNMSKESLGQGFVYTSAELVGLLKCETEFLCHFAGDVRLTKPSDWISSGINLLQERPDIAVVNPIWNSNRAEVLSDSESYDSEFAYGFGFSDQCYLVRTNELRSADLNLTHEASSRYPSYGGELFEKRVDAWMRNLNRRRATHLGSNYVHPC